MRGRAAQAVVMTGQLSNMTPVQKRVHMSDIWLKVSEEKLF